jgi:hypothetical protein
VEGEVEIGKRYTETDFNKIIEIKEREAHRVKVSMEQIDQRKRWSSAPLLAMRWPFATSSTR